LRRRWGLFLGSSSCGGSMATAEMRRGRGCGVGVLGKIWIWSAIGLSEDVKEKVRESVKEEESSIGVVK